MIKKILPVLLFIFVLHFSSKSQQNFCSLAKSKNTVLAAASTTSGIQEVLMNKYDVKFYHLNLNIERTSTYISGWVRTLALFNSTSDTFAFELHSNLSLDSVFSGTQKITVTHVGNFVYAQPAVPFASGALADIKIYYHGTPPSSGSSAFGNGFTSATDGTSGSRITFSLSQPYAAGEWFPCKQSLKDKIDSVYVFVTTDSTNKVGSNGTLKNTVIIGDHKRYEWKQIYPIDYYLISVAVGQYYDYSIYANPVNTPPILIQNYIYNTPASLSTYKPVFDKTKSIIELYCKLFGPYAFAADKYGHCMAPLGGGMEHQTMTTLGAYSFEVIAHELGHQWFGDAVTCATWSDIWVNEGFATYTAFLALQYLDTANSIGYMVGSHNTVLGVPDGSIWFTDTTNVGRIFDNRLTYQKGSSMIHMIRYEVNNDTVFFNILKEYIRRFKGGTASALDFKKVVEDVSGKDFTRFFNQWFYGEGYPTFNVFWNQIGNRLSIINAQSTSAPSSVSLFLTPLEYKIKTDKGDTTIKIFMQNNVQGTVLNIKGTVLSIQVDPSNWLLCKSTVVRDPNQLPLGMDHASLSNDNIVIYPNPTSGKFKLAITENEFVSFDVFDVQGRLVKAFTNYDSNGYDCFELKPGFYFIKLSTTSGIKRISLLLE